jgi:hypothetical protein
MSHIKNPLLWFAVAVLVSGGLTALAPEERSLGANVRIVYLHAAWVLTAEVILGFSALTGLLALLTRRERLHCWSTALGRTGIFFLLAYLPLSMWAMQANWNGLFLGEPRFRMAAIFAVSGVLLQTGLAMLARPVVSSVSNLLFFVALRIGISHADYVMHPLPSPIFSAGILSLQLYFLGIIAMTIVSAWFMTRWWLSR